MKKITINMGCGTTRIPNSIGVDRVKINNYVDVVHDLDKTPYPFKNNFADEMHAYHFLEHMHNPLKTMEEFYRILKPGGILYIRVPHFSSVGAFTDFTHVRPFSLGSFSCFEKGDHLHFYTKASFKILIAKINYFGLYSNDDFYQKYIHKNVKRSFLLRPLIEIVNFLIKLSPGFFERGWCYWVGGATEIEVVLKKI